MTILAFLPHRKVEMFPERVESTNNRELYRNGVNAKKSLPKITFGKNGHGEAYFSNPTFIARLQKVRNFLDTVATSIIFAELQIDSLLESF